MAQEMKSNVRRLAPLYWNDFEDGWQFCTDSDVDAFVAHRQLLADIINGKANFNTLQIAQPSSKAITPDSGTGYKVYYYVDRRLDVHNKFRAGKLAMQSGFQLANLPQANNLKGSEIISVAQNNLHGKIEPSHWYAQFMCNDVTMNEALQMLENNKHIFDAFYVVPIKEKAEGGRILKDRRSKDSLPKIKFGK